MDTIFRVWSDSFEDGKPIPEGFAFAKPDPMGKEHTLPAGSLPETRMVRGSNMVRIALYRKEPDLLVILVVEDNLVKGSAGQAVQAMNLVMGLPETEGLEQIALVP